MTIYFASGHAGYEMKKELLSYVRDTLGYVVEDCGAFEFNADDDYPDLVSVAARKVSGSPEDRAVVLGGSGEGEAMIANKFSNVRAVVYYGEPAKKQVDAKGNELDIIASTRAHNDANVLALGARFLTLEEAKVAVERWLSIPFSGEERHARRIEKIRRTEAAK